MSRAPLAKILIPLLVFPLLALACSTFQPAPPAASPTRASAAQQQPVPAASASPGIPTIAAPFLAAAGQSAPAPTPDQPHVLPTMRAEAKDYTVQPGDSLNNIARENGVTLNDIVTANGIENPDLLSVGQELRIPPPTPKETGPSFKILPDSELVYGPVSAYFNVAGYLSQRRTALSSYSEDIGGEEWTAARSVQRVAEQYSVNPRLLLALLEYRGGWLSHTSVKDEIKAYPLDYPDRNRPGLYRQLAWAANNLNRGYYLWRVNGVSHWVLSDGSYVPPSPVINAGTAGVQQLMALFFDYESWKQAVSGQGLYRTYAALFGDPFSYTYEPLVPAGLKQPRLQLPFEKGVAWSFTGGPHGGWGDGSAWAALDFGPPGDTQCTVENDAWEVAVADGVILRAGEGEVIQDLDGDGFEQTGWVVLYLHVESRDRIHAGTQVKAGDRIGHPSCEGGYAPATHLHLARRYNGEWIPADGQIPFNLDGWISQGYGSEYDGILKHDDTTVEAWGERKPENQISR